MLKCLLFISILNLNLFCSHIFSNLKQKDLRGQINDSNYQEISFYRKFMAYLNRFLDLFTKGHNKKISSVIEPQSNENKTQEPPIKKTQAPKAEEPPSEKESLLYTIYFIVEETKKLSEYAEQIRIYCEENFYSIAHAENLNNIFKNIEYEYQEAQKLIDNLENNLKALQKKEYLFQTFKNPAAIIHLIPLISLFKETINYQIYSYYYGLEFAPYCENPIGKRLFPSPRSNDAKSNAYNQTNVTRCQRYFNELKKILENTGIDYYLDDVMGKMNTVDCKIWNNQIDKENEYNKMDYFTRLIKDISNIIEKVFWNIIKFNNITKIYNVNLEQEEIAFEQKKGERTIEEKKLKKKDYLYTQRIKGLK
jgi:hypothetical protein